jgi:hypothetical protein
MPSFRLSVCAVASVHRISGPVQACRQERSSITRESGGDFSVDQGSAKIISDPFETGCACNVVILPPVPVMGRATCLAIPLPWPTSSTVR